MEDIKNQLLSHQLRVPGNFGEDTSYSEMMKFKKMVNENLDVDEKYHYYSEEKRMYLKEKAEREAARAKAEKEAEEARLAIPAPTVESIEAHKRTMAMARRKGLIS